MSEVETYENIKASDKDIIYGLTILGPHHCGKSSLVQKFIHDKEEKENETSNSVATKKYTIKILQEGEKSVYLRIFIPSWSDDAARMRFLTVAGSEYIILCFSSNDRLGFSEVSTVIKDTLLKKKKDTAKIILLKTKKDLEQNSGEDLVTDEEVSELAKEVDAFKVFKCSISTDEGISDVFDAAVMDILKKEKVNKKAWYQCLCC